MPSAAQEDHPLRRMINDVSNSRNNNNAEDDAAAAGNEQLQQNNNQANNNNNNNNDTNNNMDDHNNNANNNNEDADDDDSSSDDSQRTQTNNDPNWPFIFHSPTDDDTNNNGLGGGNNAANGDDLLMNDAMDPFNVDSYKLLHTPGHGQCRGRNILSVLNDRSLNGPRFRNGGHYFGNGNVADVDVDVGAMNSEGEKEEEGVKKGENYDAMDIQQQPQQQQQEEEVRSTLMQKEKSQPPSTPTLPLVNLSTPGAASTTNDNNNNNEQEVINNQSYLSPLPPQNQQNQQEQNGSSNNNDQFQTPSNSAPNSPSARGHGGDNHSSTTPMDGSSLTFPLTTGDEADVVPSNPTDVTNEITSFAEFAAATKFRASYLKHLNGGLALPARPGGGNGSGRSGGSGRSSGMMTMEQIDTSRQLRQHLRGHRGGRRAGSGANNPVIAANNNRGNNNSNNNNNVPMRQIHQQLGRQPHPQHPQQRVAPPLGNNNHRSSSSSGRHHHQQQQQRSTNPAVNPNPAVSTISISFSPDARTLASTHGDHTVKITCCHTGKLIRQLEGHPRTPWTVKYHPTNSRIVASGCLGFQVRVWDWNYQKESLRKERRLEREKRWRGRYDRSSCGGGGRMRMNNGDREGMVMGGGCVDSADYLGKSPRGVVEHPWRQGSSGGGVTRRNDESDYDDDDEEGGTDCANSSETNSWGLPSHLTIDENDDYAAYALAEAGIPPEDPAWYDTEADAFDYDSGIGVCLNMIRLQSAVISLSFHPSGEMLAMASGSTLHLWDYNGEKRKRQAKADAAGVTNALTGRPISSTVTRESEILNRSENANFSGSAQPGQTMEFRHDSALRCVHFPPCGSKLIVGGVNPPSHNEGLPNHRANDPRRGRGGMSGGGMSFHLRIFDFDLDAVVNPSPRDGPLANARIPRGGRISDDGELAWNYQVVKEALNNPRTIIPRVLLYNDGGFDLSKDGTILSACADFWLPDGVDNAMDLVRSQQQMEEEAKQKQKHHSPSSPPTGDHYSPGGGSDSLASSPVMSGIQGNFSSPPPRQMPTSFADPRTPPPNFSLTSLEPPSPPGKRNIANMPRGGQPAHTPHPLSVVAAGHPANSGGGGRYVPHIVIVSLDTTPPPGGEPMPLDPKIVRTEGMRRHPKLGQLLMAAPLDGAKSSGVTCVKLSPSSEYVLLGYGVRENIPSVDDGGETRHPVTSLYNVKKGMKHVCTLTCGDDDVNIARFHPESGHGFVYGTKQGRVRVLSKRPWNYYHLNDD